MQNKKSLQYNLEKELATFLLDEFEKLKLSPKQVKIIANFFLNLIPSNCTDEELKNKLSTLDPNFFKEMKLGNFEKALKALKIVKPNNL